MLTQAEADRIMAATKWTDEPVLLPVWTCKPGTRQSKPIDVLGCPDGYSAKLWITRTDLPGNAPRKLSIQFRELTTGETLLRLEVGSKHRNPGNELLDCPHIHREVGPRRDYAQRYYGPLPDSPEHVSRVIRWFLAKANIDAPTQEVLFW